MPVLALALGPVGTIARYVRSSLLDALHQDYVRTAWAKGGNYFRVVVGHALAQLVDSPDHRAGPHWARS